MRDAGWVQTCRLLELDPYEYLVWVLPKLVVHPDNRGRKIADLTPAAYQRIKADPEGFS
ncbi:MAG: transposase domain-containing protein [Myxococcota bacterium]